MKKILLAFDGTHFCEGAFEFARQLNELKPILLVGAFLPQTTIANLWSYADGMGGAVYVPLLDEEESEQVKKNIEHFENRCKNNGIEYRVHKYFFDLALPELKKESRFADLLILSSEIFYENMDSNLSNEYLKDVLHQVECPVLIVPEKFYFPKSILLAYDGSNESVYAIKQFSYLFPELSYKETILAYANDDSNADFPEKIQIEELAARHYKNLTLTKLNINPKKYFGTWIREKQSALLVSGSYGRSGLSQLFTKSFVKEVIAEHLLPVFIAHK
jgi:nucleotide-binding universal stress UspA family protein